MPASYIETVDRDFLDQADQYESLYSRDVEGRLIRIEDATQNDLVTDVSLKIDGKPITVKKASLTTDDQGNVRRDARGVGIPRLSTIYDAAGVLASKEAADAHRPLDAVNPIPVLCHQEHVKPVAVCRVCSVLLTKNNRVGGRLVPGCHHPVVEGMEAHTTESTVEVTLPNGAKIAAGDEVKKAVRVLIGMLAGDHLHAGQQQEGRYLNELARLATRLNVDGAQATFARKPRDPKRIDDSSPVILVDHNNCILCDRCVRACSEVKPFRVIGHTGYGNRAKVSFDLNAPMFDSNCVSCGECAVSCPTGALTFKGTVYQERDPWHDWPDQAHRPVTIPADELRRQSLFAGIPYSYVKWNEGSVGRLACDNGYELCRKGDYGPWAFLIEQGAVEVNIGRGEQNPKLSAGDIAGEMACLTNQPRTATLRTVATVSVLVLRRNMVHMLQRNKVSRGFLQRVYVSRALGDCLRRGRLFAALSAQSSQQCVELLASQPTDEVGLVRADPNEVIVAQGQPADAYYIVYVGHVKVTRTTPTGGELVLGHNGAGWHFGDIGLMSQLSQRVKQQIPAHEWGRRTATCTALDHVELVRISKAAFQRLVATDPALFAQFETTSLEMLRAAAAAASRFDPRVAELTRQGLFQGQSLLVVDLRNCTRCQECVNACSDSHGGVSRLILEGNRFDNFLVPSACRSCHDPLCLVGCPVDAIHRRPPSPGKSDAKSLAIFIENHCIGCGLCAHSCPFGSIHMYQLPQAEGGKRAAVRRVATNCDLCESLDADPRCVYACPHDAAHRVIGNDLLR